MSALVFSILQGILSGPVAFVESTSDRSLAIPWVCIARGGIVVYVDVGMSGRFGCSWVKTD